MKIIIYLFLSIFLICLNVAIAVNFEKTKSQTFWHGDRKFEYFLTEHFEEERRIFQIFLSRNSELQDLVLSKSFSIKDTSFSNAWLHNIEKKYQFVEKKISNFDYSFQDYYGSKKSDVIWNVEHEWNIEYEKKFGLWVKENFHPNFFKELNLETDCADAAYSLRWIFSRIHKLPMAVHLAGSGVLFTNEMVKVEWRKLKRDENWKNDLMFMASLKYLLKNTYTQTLMKDSYPVSIDKENFTPGIFHLHIYGTGGHTMIVYKVNEENDLPIRLLFSTLPREVRELIPTFYQETETPKLFESGFYKIRWAKKINNKMHLIPANEIQGYSLKQFQLKSDDEKKEIPHYLKIYKLLNPNFSFEIMAKTAFSELKNRILDRIEIVEKGFEFCKINNCEPGSTGEENWSTPSRDKRIFGLHESLNTAMDFIKEADSALFEKMNRIFRMESSLKKIEINREWYSLNDLLIAFLHELVISDPRVSVEERWGVSLNGIILNLKRMLNEIWPKRLKLVEDAQFCRLNNCAATSKEYLKYNSFEMDRKISKAILGAWQICDISKNFNCNDLNSEFKYEEKFLNFQDLLFNTVKWVSDPNASEDLRWGRIGKIFPLAFNNTNVQFSKNKNFFLHNHKIFNAKNFEEIVMNEGEKVGSINSQLDKFFTYKISGLSLNIFIKEFPNFLERKLAIPIGTSKIIKVFWNGDISESIIVFLDQKCLFLNLDGKIIKEFVYDKVEINANFSNWVLASKNHEMYFFDLTKEVNNFFKIELLNNETIESVERTKLGTAITTTKNFYYYERDKLFFKSKINNANETYQNYFLNKSGNRLVVSTSSNRSFMEIYFRNSSFVFEKKINGYINSLNDQYLNIAEEVKKEVYVDKVLNFDNLNFLEFPCQKNNPLMSVRMLGTKYYTCNNDKIFHFYNKNHELICTFKNNNEFFNFYEKSPEEILVFKMNFESGITSNYVLKNGQMRGPYFISSNQDYFDSSSNVNTPEIAPPLN